MVSVVESTTYVSSPNPPVSVSVPALPSSLLFPELPVSALPDELPVASMLEAPVSVRCSTFDARVNVTDEVTTSVPWLLDSVMVSPVLSIT